MHSNRSEWEGNSNIEGCWFQLLGPLFFAFVLQKIISAVDIDDECIGLLFHASFLDDGLLAGSTSAVLQKMHLVEELGSQLGILSTLLNVSFLATISNTFPAVIKSFHVPHFEILGAP